ncbi:hypothetical protein ACIRQH_19870 [Streptomyces sp. NPDC102279]|uniref:hypothetical protein n=1 Tax=Streptomyces sp. NPDC102279 TaxID=3366153 RepID=UPI0038213BEC
MTREPDTEPEDDAVDEDEESTGRARTVVLLVVGAVASWRIISVFPEVAYVATGIVGTVVVQKTRQLMTRDKEPAEAVEDEEQPDVGEALRRLVGDDNGVLLTRLQRDLKLHDTKAVKQLLDDAGIPWKGVRTRDGNSTGVHVKDIPAAPSPSDHSHGDGCCCRSGDNANSNNGSGPGTEEGIRVEPIENSGGHILRGSLPERSDATVEDLVTRFLAEIAKRNPGPGEVNKP